EIVREGMAQTLFRIPNCAGTHISRDLSKFQQVVLEKQALDVFDNPNTEIVLRLLRNLTDPNAEFFVFGVVTEYFVRFAAKGLLERKHKASLSTDAIEALNSADGPKAIDELVALGARLVKTSEVLSRLDQSFAKAHT